MSESQEEYRTVENQSRENQSREPVITMFLCETEALVLKANQLYKFVVHPDCPLCTRLEKVYKEKRIS